MFDQVKKYIVEMRGLGYSEDKIKLELKNTGWSEKVIDDALDNTDKITPETPLPTLDNISSKKKSDELKLHENLIMSFFYITNFVTLWVTTYTVIFLLSNLIDMTIPLNSSNIGFQFSSQEINQQISTLIVTIPTFVVLSFLIHKKIKKNNEFRFFRSRKSLIIIMLTIMFGVIMLETILFINSVLGGIVNLNYFLKYLSILVILLPIFFYYFNDISADKKYLEK